MRLGDWHVWFQLVHVVVVLFAVIGAIVGALIGIPFGSWQQGLGIGAVCGALIGLVAGIVFTRRMATDLNKPVMAPPGGWRRWDDDDD